MHHIYLQIDVFLKTFNAMYLCQSLPYNNQQIIVIYPSFIPVKEKKNV